MNIFSRLAGKLVYGLAKLIDGIFNILIAIVETIVVLISGLGRGFLAIIGMGGCLFLFLLMSPLGLVLLLHPTVILTILFFIVVPILGTKFVSYLKYRRYMITEYLFDYANYLSRGEKSKYGSFREYGNRYKQMEEERKREEYRKRQEEQARQWEERFRQWQDFQNSQRGSGGFGGWSYEQTGQGGYQGFGNVGQEFKNKYEKSCDLLGVSYDADKYEIKLAYRKKAKEYHPDLNKAANATELFQKINDAYEFLNDDNIERYKNLN